MRAKFDEQLEQLNRDMITMGMMCENAIKKTAAALVEEDVTLAKELPEMLAEINQAEREIERFCIQLFMQQQPVARDLLTISAALKMVTDMERIGDQSADIADIIRVGNIYDHVQIQDFQKMTDAVLDMVNQSIDAFVNKDTDLAKKVIKYDDIVDAEFAKLKNVLIGQLKTPGSNGEAVLDQLMIAKYFERIGDHAELIAKWVIFSVTGEPVTS